MFTLQRVHPSHRRVRNDEAVHSRARRSNDRRDRFDFRFVQIRCYFEKNHRLAVPSIALRLAGHLLARRPNRREQTSQFMIGLQGSQARRVRTGDIDHEIVCQATELLDSQSVVLLDRRRRRRRLVPADVHADQHI